MRRVQKQVSNVVIDGPPNAYGPDRLCANEYCRKKLTVLNKSRYCYGCQANPDLQTLRGEKVKNAPYWGRFRKLCSRGCGRYRHIGKC